MARAEDLAAPAWLPQPQGHPTYRLASTGYFGEIGPVRSTRPAGPYSNLTEVWDGLDLDLFRTLGDSTRKDSALLEKPAAPPSPPASRCSSPSSELYDSSESQEVEQGAGSSAARCQLATPLECDDVKAMVQLLCNLKLQQYLPALLEEGFNHSSLLLLTYSDVHWLRNDFAGGLALRACCKSSLSPWRGARVVR